MQRRFVALLAGLAVIAGTACSNDDDNGGATTTPTTTPTTTATATSDATVATTPEPTESATDAASAGSILAALLHIDGAGFHGMDEALNGDAPEIDSAWLGATRRARTAAQAIAWPEGVQPAADEFISAAMALEEALDADDAAAAAEPATAAHETQHTLSHDAYHYLGELTAVDESAGGVLAAIAIIDDAGFHGMDDALNGDAPAIEAAWSGATNRARIAAQVIAWPGESQAAADEFIAAAQALEAALDADDAGAAAEPTTAAHETQHSLSHDAYHHLGGLSGADDSAGAVLAALNIIDGAGFHGMDDALNGDAPAIEASWVGATERSLAAARMVAWPSDAQGAADAFIEAAEALLAALEADDAGAAAEPATAAHETQHTLSHDAYAALGGGGGH